MARRPKRREAPGPSGFLVVDKPPGWTSHDVVDAARRWLGTRRVGHLGTLDPQATGVLPLAVREATKLVPFVEGGRKTYFGTIRLGIETDTLDAEGEILRHFEGPLPDAAEVAKALGEFVGDILQIPPMYSAVKRFGVPLYRLARKGQHVEREPRKVRIESLRMTGFEPPDVQIEVICSPGTYVRSLAADLGTRLGCGAYLTGLRRTHSGPFDLSQAVSVPDLEAEADSGRIHERLLSEVEVLGLPTYPLAVAEARRVSQGEDIPAIRGTVEASAGARVAALAPSGVLLAILEWQPDRRLRPIRVLRPLASGG